MENEEDTRFEVKPGQFVVFNNDIKVENIGQDAFYINMSKHGYIEFYKLLTVNEILTAGGTNENIKV